MTFFLFGEREREREGEREGGGWGGGWGTKQIEADRQTKRDRDAICWLSNV